VQARLNSCGGVVLGNDDGDERRSAARGGRLGKGYGNVFGEESEVTDDFGIEVVVCVESSAVQCLGDRSMCPADRFELMVGDVAVMTAAVVEGLGKMLDGGDFGQF
jgi:hypothetical protein